MFKLLLLVDEIGRRPTFWLGETHPKAVSVAQRSTTKKRDRDSYILKLSKVFGVSCADRRQLLLLADGNDDA